MVASAASNPLRLPAESPYDVLGLPKGTEKSEVRSLFRKRVQTEHPDINPGDEEAAKRFQELVAAYNAIMGDELLPDELLAVRVQQTPRYQQGLRQELRIGNGVFFALLPGLGLLALGLGFFILDNSGVLDPDTKRLAKLVMEGNGS